MHRYSRHPHHRTCWMHVPLYWIVLDIHAPACKVLGWTRSVPCNDTGACHMACAQALYFVIARCNLSGHTFGPLPSILMDLGYGLGCSSRNNQGLLEVTASVDVARTQPPPTPPPWGSTVLMPPIRALRTISTMLAPAYQCTR